MSEDFIGKRLWGGTSGLENHDCRSLKSFINSFDLSMGARTFLESRYLNFVYKKSLFYLTNKKNFIQNSVNSYFFYDFTESFVKFLYRKLIFGYVSFSLGGGSSFKFMLEQDFNINFSISSVVLSKLKKVFNLSTSLRSATRKKKNTTHQFKKKT